MVTPLTRAERHERNANVLADLGAHGGRTEDGQTLVVVRIVGARTGREHRMPLCVCADGDDLVIAASAGGQAEHPQWYCNLQARPGVVVEYLGRTFAAIATTEPNGPVRDRLFAALSNEIHGLYGYQDRCRDQRQIPIIRLAPTPNRPE